ncbi:MAG: putative bifunctional diguanylate cyclase/phosphodiesterase, partial [Arenimonas sp.]
QPILSPERKVLGSFAIYHRQPHAPGPADLRLIEEAAQLASIALERENAQYDQRIAATAFETSKGMMITGPDMAILRVNRAFTAITGYDPQDVIGKTPRILSSDRHDRRFYEAMWRDINETGGWEGEIWNRRRNGEVYPQFLMINSVKAEDGTVSNYVASLEDITESKEADAKIHNLAFFDVLTQLPNRRLLADRLGHALAGSTRTGKHGALLMVDLDRFKTINETLGYEAGDQLLKQVAARLSGCVFEGDTVARTGADEFVVLLEGLSDDPGEAAAGVEMAVNRILAVLSAAYPLAGRDYHGTVGIGATLFLDHDCSMEELLKQTEIAMNQAKLAGPNTLRFFDPAMQAAIAARADLEAELRKAIELGQFELHYQLQVDHAARATGAEALVRWRHPERGMIPPFRFIPLAEETGLILAIGDWVLDTACARLKAWQNGPTTGHLSVAVNVSARQFNQEGFVAQVRELVARHGIDPSKLKLELTESMLLDDIDAMIDKMNALREIGVGLELDDFGTGYSSLQYLKRLPIEQLKIDQSFVRDLVDDDNDKAIVRTIISMAHSLNLGVIAEGVETEEQRRYLESQGCRHYQGYLFGRPGPAADIEAALRQTRE